MGNKKWILYAIQHSHTDIGYTDRQERIELYHVDFIRQALSILKEIYAGIKAPGFKWVCESFWCVEKFLEMATVEEVSLFEEALIKGDIELSANYLNLTELVDYKILSKKIAKCVNYAKALGVEVKSAMSADINGYSWGFAQALAHQGVENLFSCIHTHHGMYPLRQKQIPFWWETPEGDKVFVWNGEYYHIGNELGLAEGYETTYMIMDEFSGRPSKEERWDRVQIRINRYLNRLEEEGYPYDFVPVMVSGMITDNSPPSYRICEFIEKWNSHFKETIEIKMVTLDEFFKQARAQVGDIPTYKGDWTDWWADGVGSTPAALKSYKDAQRKYHLCELLRDEQIQHRSDWIEEAEDNLMIYAEHTWGYSSSISEPCNTMVNELDMRKTCYASKANERISRTLDHILYEKGDALLYPRDNFQYRIINPYPHPIKDIARLYVGYWDNFNEKICVKNKETGMIYKHQVESASRGIEISLLVELAAREEIVVSLEPLQVEAGHGTVMSHAYIGSERVRDIVVADNTEDIVTPLFLDNTFFTIKYTIEKGIYSWYDKVAKKELIDQKIEDLPFTPIYQKTAIYTNLYEERRKMGRNRKGQHAQTYRGQVTAINVLTDGPLFRKVELVYDLEGTNYNSVVLTAYNDLPRVEVVYRVIKENTVEPENLYLPLTLGGEDSGELWIEKSGCCLRPGIDQLPGTCMEYYLLQNGLAYVAEDRTILIATKDAPLIFMGGLDYHMIPLCDQDPKDNKRPVYGWLMNNFWETNFKATLGGAYEFTYVVETTSVKNVSSLMEQAASILTGIVAFSIKA